MIPLKIKLKSYFSCLRSIKFLSLGKIKEIRDMINQINFQFLTVAVTFFIIVLLGVTGTLQEFIHFTDVLNEIAVICVSLFGGVIFSLGIKK